MHEFDDNLRKGMKKKPGHVQLDNFQFVDFHKVIKESENSEMGFATAAMMELPTHFQGVKKLIWKRK